MMEEIKSELHEVVESVHTLIDHMDQSLPSERVQALVDGVIEEERRSRKRFYIAIFSPLLIIIVVSFFGLIQSHSNGDTLNEARTVASYVRDCLQHPEKLTDQQKADRCGTSGAASQKFFISYLNCVLLIRPVERTQELVNSCVIKALGGS